MPGTSERLRYTHPSHVMPSIRLEKAKDICLPLFELMGCSSVEANSVVDNLLQAEKMGHSSHGVGMVPRYVESFIKGYLRPNMSVRFIRDSESFLMLDGGLGFGQTLGLQAIDLAMKRASISGSCIFTLSNAHHLGRRGAFAEFASHQGFISILFANVISRPIVSPWGGKVGKHGTNPICIGIPRKFQPSFILDFATSIVAQGKMRDAFNRKERVKQGLVKDYEGNDTDDPSSVVIPNSDGKFGSLYTFGEHKGAGLALACEFLAGVLSGGGAFDPAKVKLPAIINNLFGVLIQPHQLKSDESFFEEVERFITWVKFSESQSNDVEISVAGEPEFRNELKADKVGLDIADETLGQISLALSNLKKHLKHPGKDLRD
ncbi:MAG: Ldh family oxidoreductase [Burkholderiales bacterium]